MGYFIFATIIFCIMFFSWRARVKVVRGDRADLAADRLKKYGDEGKRNRKPL